MGDPQISIIVPVYNAQNYISRCIKSVQKQHYDQWELILIDDGSMDRSGCICDEYAERDNRIRVIHQNNQGVSAARNAALKYITGQYLMFLDADDYIHPECIATFVSYADTYGADLVMARHDRLEADGTLHHDSPDWSQYNTSEKVRLALLRNDLPNFVWGKIYKTALWQNITFPENMVMEDMYVMADLVFRASKLVVIPEYLYVYSHEKEDSIMNISGKGYLQVRYGKFISWAKHGEVIRKHGGSGHEFCESNAVHAAIRAYTLDYGSDILTAQQKDKIQVYLKKHHSVNIKWVDNWCREQIIENNRVPLFLLGVLQRKILKLQMKRRHDRIRREKARRKK